MLMCINTEKTKCRVIVLRLKLKQNKMSTRRPHSSFRTISRCSNFTHMNKTKFITEEPCSVHMKLLDINHLYNICGHRHLVCIVHCIAWRGLH